MGRKSARLVRAASLKLAQEMFSMIKRPEFAVVMQCLEGFVYLLYITNLHETVFDDKTF